MPTESTDITQGSVLPSAPIHNADNQSFNDSPSAPYDTTDGASRESDNGASSSARAVNTRTPPGAPVIGIGETPSRYRASQSSNFFSSQLNSQRERVAEDHRSIPLVPLKQFREYVLPRSLSDKDIELVLNAIDVKSLKETVRKERQEKSLRNGTERGKKEQKVEIELFEHIKIIYDKVVSAGNQALNRPEISKLSYKPTKAPISMERDNTSIPDCNLVLAKTTSCQGNTNDTNDTSDANDTDVYYCDVFATCEFKKNSSATEIYENRKQLIWNMRHIMREDPCRRFVYGISIENRDMRIWQANRADVFVSEAFDYIENLEECLAVLAQLVFAKKSDLGWDESIIRTAPCTYNIRVGDEWYRTDQVMSDVAADDLTGHASRVWLATPLSGNDQVADNVNNGANPIVADNTEQIDTVRKPKQVVIKDNWPGLQTIPEDEIQRLLLRELSEDERKKLKRHLFTIRSCEKLKIDDKEDNSLDTILHGLDTDKLASLSIRPPEEHGYDPTRSASQSARRGTSLSSRLSSASRARGSKRRSTYRSPTTVTVAPFSSVHHRYHYRMVMEEVATPVRQVDDAEKGLIAYRDGLVVVAILSAHDWVHRDISAGNIYYYDGRGIVGDFEYAKKINSGKRFGAKTGTRNYMALEVAIRQYLFFHSLDTNADGGSGSYLSLMASERKQRTPFRFAKKKVPRPHFYHNPLHDTESIWWGCIELLLRRKWECTPSSETDERTVLEMNEEYGKNYKKLKVATSNIFPDDEYRDERLKFFYESDVQEEILSLLPRALDDICNNLSVYGKDLVSRYIKAEQSIAGTINPEAYAANEIVSFVDILDATIPFARGMKLKAFPQKWDKQANTTSLVNDAGDDQPTGSKRRLNGAPDNPRVAKKSCEDEEAFFDV